MNITLDLILLAVFLLFTVIGIKRGFIRSAAHFLGALLASFLASALGGPIARWAFDALFREALVRRVSEAMNSFGVESVAAGLQKLLSSLPDFLFRILEEAGITVSALEGIVANGSGQAAELVADALSPVFVSFLKVAAVLVLFLLFMMIVRGLADLLATVFRLPLLRQLDGALGGLFGFLLALVVVWLLIAAARVFLPMMTEEAQADLEIALNHSVLAGLLAGSDPLGVLFR